MRNFVDAGTAASRDTSASPSPTAAAAMLLSREVTETGSYRYYELIGGAPERVDVVGPQHRRQVLFRGEASGRPLQDLPGCFVGPLDPPHPG